MILSATGHRPDKLGGYSYEVTNKLTELAEQYLDEVTPDKIISGMALGWDMAWANAGIRLGYPVIAAIPFEGQESMWRNESKRDYFKLLDKCSEIVYVNDPGYAVWKMQSRNEWMVDNSDMVVALWDGSKGGTANCIRYANKVNKSIVNLWERYNK